MWQANCRLLWAVGLLAVTNGGSAPRVRVAQGILEGEELALVTGNGTYYSFKGVPYAEPPIGHLRFESAKPVAPWKGVRSATKHGPVCFQFNVIRNVIAGSEDCLYLNVYTPPAPPSLQPRKMYPVMFFVHGGNFMWGSGNSEEYSPDFLIPHDVILITINYRLAHLGFLSLQNDAVPGNNGLKDQNAALKWVKQNIRQFGGDPSKITIFGESAGSLSVGYHLFSETSNGLFNRAILQSGTPLNGWSLSYFPRERAFNLGKMLGLNTDNDAELLQFLKAVPVEKLVTTNPTVVPWEEIVRNNFVSACLFCPVVEPQGENRFLTMSGQDYLNTGQVSDVDLMVGYTSEEGIAINVYFKSHYDVMNLQNEYFLLSPMAYSSNDLIGYKIATAIKKYYLGNKKPAEEVNLDLIKYFSYSVFKYGIEEFLKSLPESRSCKTYKYQFSAETERNYFKPIYYPSDIEVPGTSHLDDLPYLFYIPAVNDTVDTCGLGYEVVLRTTKLWADFAKYGNPTPGDSDVEWQPWTRSRPHYINIGTSKLSPGVLTDDKEYAFWKTQESYALGNAMPQYTKKCV